MPFKLKESENAFQVTREGDFEYQSFTHGKVYDKVPAEEADRFDEINELKAKS